MIERRHGGVMLVVAVVLLASFATRLVLLGAAGGLVAWDGSLLAAFVWGGFFDLGVALLAATPLVLLLAALPRRALRKGGARWLAGAGLLSMVGGLLFVAVAEWLFWAEFEARLNFIAVDYLIYTTEVLGNIRESYPLPLIFTGLFAATLAIAWLVRRSGILQRWLRHSEEPVRARWLAAACWLGAATLFGAGLDEVRLPAFVNNFNRELAKNGVWSFFAAFRANELDFETFYPTMPADAAFRRVRRLVLGRPGAETGPRSLLRPVSHPGPERRLNVIQITVESLSAEFMARYGGRDQITPHLDALVPRALVFDRFYATGTRTDRGMEALTLSVPPTPGRSLVKRPDNKNLFTLGSVFRRRGYETVFLYGGFGYFDNMNAFFGGNGYRLVDRAAVDRDDVTFANIWGACDEDLLRWTMREADTSHAAGRPFFHFVMTTSNHRPFTFPDGRIDLPSKTAGRAGGVKYTDHAIGSFLQAAAGKPWFYDTLFVVVADHCASSAGRAELPVHKYHIPLLIYAPGGQVAPGVVDRLASQIDYGPTLLGLLGWSYSSRFYGRDLLAPGAEAVRGRALLGTYQSLGLYFEGADPNLVVLKPVPEAACYHFDPTTARTQSRAADPDMIADAIAYYQSASHRFRRLRPFEHESISP